MAKMEVSKEMKSRGRKQFTEVTTAGLSKGISEPRVEGGMNELAIQPSGGGALQTGETAVQRSKDGNSQVCSGVLTWSKVEIEME